MTTPDQEILEPYAVSFVSEPQKTGTQVLEVGQGKISAGSSTRAALPVGMITITGVMTRLKDVQIRLFRVGGSNVRFSYPLDEDKPIPVIQFSTKPGDYITAWGTNTSTSMEGELLLTVIPMPFSE